MFKFIGELGGVRFYKTIYGTYFGKINRIECTEEHRTVFAVAREARALLRL